MDTEPTDDADPVASPAAPTGGWGPPDPATLLAWLPDPVIVVDEAGQVTWANRRAELTFGTTLDEGRGTPVADMVHPDDLVTAVSSLASVQEKDLGTAVEVRVRHRDGSWLPVEVRGWSGLHDPRVRGVVLSLRRIDDRGGWNVTAGDARRQAAVLDTAPSLTVLVDSHGRLEGANRAFTTSLGVDLEGTLGRFLTDLVVDDDVRSVRDELAAVLLDGRSRSFEATFRSATERAPTPYWLTAANLLDDVTVRAVVISGVAIARLVEARDRLAHQATHDALTGLANRVLLMERLDVALRSSVGTTARVGLVFCDIDGFKRVNDDHGHHVGDDVLVEVAARIRAQLHDDDTVGRLGGDEIVVVTVRDSVAEVEATMARIVDAVEVPVATSEGPVTVRLSAGCAVARQGARSEDLLRRADQAMYAVKRSRS